MENADSLLYETVCEQVKLVNKYDLPATFLLQYDALINPLYQDLLKSKLNDHSEIGAWWELTQPQIEAAGIKWRGEHSWVSHANIAFSTGYTKEERERLVDVYMAKFKEIFGTYPKSVGSWFIDAHTLGYMYDKYKIVASCNCKRPSGDGWLYPMGWLLEPSLLPKPDKRLYAGADRGGANPRSYFPYAGQ